jgi:hypothetical protein
MRERDRYAIYLYENDPYYHRLVDVLIDALENIPDPNLLHDAVNLAADKTMMERYYKKIELLKEVEP